MDTLCQYGDKELDHLDFLYVSTHALAKSRDRQTDIHSQRSTHSEPLALSLQRGQPAVTKAAIVIELYSYFSWKGPLGVI